MLNLSWLLTTPKLKAGVMFRTGRLFQNLALAPALAHAGYNNQAIPVLFSQKFTDMELPSIVYRNLGQVVIGPTFKLIRGIFPKEEYKRGQL
jgi:hypothetical protein